MLRASARWALPTAYLKMVSVGIAAFALFFGLAVGLPAIAGSRGNAERRVAAPVLPDAPHLDTPPPLYLGLEAYRHWDKLSYLEIGDRVWGQTTADPAASNNDNSHIMRVLTDGERVLFDQLGRGIMTFMRHQESYGSPCKLYLDGNYVTTVDPSA